jgi:hypothetical protein
VRASPVGLGHEARRGYSVASAQNDRRHCGDDHRRDGNAYQQAAP